MKKKTYTVAGAAFTAAALALSYHENRCLDVCHLRVRSFLPLLRDFELYSCPICILHALGIIKSICFAKSV